ncbi:MAG: P-II family nitrogen regulator [Clostridia bacterium]|nr:P-II family nitrogen regulator [Clostridia bacterium]
MNGLYLLMTIVRRTDAAEYEAFFRSNEISVTYSANCNGTAHAKTLALLGIEKNEKTLLLSFVSEDLLPTVLKGLTRDMKIDLPDRGIAVAVALSGIGGARALEYFTAGQTMENDGVDTKQREERAMQSTHELIIAIYEKGYTDLVMDAARAAGAAGGTTIRAKGTGAGAEKFFGLSLAEEKEIVLIVSDTEKKKDIMKGIMQGAGIETKAHALVFSLPVTDTAGFRFSDTVDKD